MPLTVAGTTARIAGLPTGFYDLCVCPGGECDSANEYNRRAATFGVGGPDNEVPALPAVCIGKYEA